MEEVFILYLEVNRWNGTLVNCHRVRDILTWEFGIEIIIDALVSGSQEKALYSPQNRKFSVTSA